MCYIIITGGSSLWFLLSLVADMLVMTAIMTPRWLVGSTAYIDTYNTPEQIHSLLMSIEDEHHRQQLQRKLQQMQQQEHQQHLPYIEVIRNQKNYEEYQNNTERDSIDVSPSTLTTTTMKSSIMSFTDYRRYPSVGIHSRCKAMQGGTGGFHCGRFDLDGFATDAHIYPDAWKAAMFFICLGYVLLSTSVLGTLISCCRQALCGKSLHNVIACWQVAAGLSIVMALFLHPMGWTSERVRILCGPDVEPFYSANCSMGMSFYCAASGALLCFICAGLSGKAEASNLRSRVKRRVEEGERLVCIP